MVTLGDVAKEANVSVATVSRAINNSLLVTEEKVERINAAIKKLGYQPAVRQKRSNTAANKVIAVVAAMLQPNLLDSIRDTAYELGYELAISYTGEGKEGYDRAMSLLRILSPDTLSGIITINNLYRDKQAWKEFSNYPIVQIGEYADISPCYAVLTDDTLGAADMTQYLIDKGHSRIAFVTNKRFYEKDHFRFARQREEGFRQTLIENDIEFDESLKLYVDYTQEGGREAAQKIIAMKNKPDAVFCIGDIVAASCVNELSQAGLKVPEEIAVVGYDNMEISEYCRPQLTTVAQSFEDIGAEAVRTLDMIINGSLSIGRKIYIGHRILERESS